VRAFPAGVGIVEDPASGAANGLIAAWIALREPEGALAHGYRVSQGREMGRDASILLQIDQGAQPRVWVGGTTRTMIRGHVDWPLGVCRTLVGRAANPSARSIFPPLLGP
jgi:PhzF family phenazine biosynthesis protein